jgi:mannose-6-phosphate isomerase-like protein (cupin superfamily)
MRPPKLADAIDRIYSVFAGYERPPMVDFCTFCFEPREIDYFRRTALKEFEPDMARRLVWESSDHWQDTSTYKHYLPMILDSLAPPRRCDAMYEDHLFETIRAHGFAGWPVAEREAFRAYVLAVHDALHETDPREAQEWKTAAGRLAGGPYTSEDSSMPTLIPAPKVIQAAGNKPKKIEEFVGRVNSGTAAVSVARMQSPSGWVEPGQTPEFDEYTVVLRGSLRVTSKQGAIDVQAGQAVITHKGEWVQYSTPGPEGAEYIAVCLPAFAPDIVHRDV